jgi:hypothetical protein
VPEDQKEPNAVNPFSKTEKQVNAAAAPEGEPRIISPFMVITRGEDTVDPETEALIFADFSPTVLPSDAQEEIPVVIPKAESAPGRAPSSELMQTLEQQKSDIPVQTPAEVGDGILKNTESLSPSSSSDPKSGPSEQPV